MPRVTLVQTNFTAGEISPRMLGRTDIARYHNGAQIIENAWPVVHGGCVRRDGTVMCAPAKFPDRRARLVPYVFNTEQAYMCEFGDLYVRIYYPDGSFTGVELVSPYDQTMLASLDFGQGADTMFIFHQRMPISRLRRSSNTEWSLAFAPFVTTPFEEKGDFVNSAMTIDDPSVGVGRTLSTTAAMFLAADQGRDIISGSGRATIAAVVNSSTVTVTVREAFNSTTLPHWALQGSPQTTNTPSAKDPFGESTTLTLTQEGWRPGDVDKFVKINGGLVQITQYTSATVVTGIIRAVMTAAVGSPMNAWSLESSVWNAIDGYPATGTLREQRLVTGGSPSYPQAIWQSRTGEYLNFELGTKDDDALMFNVSSDQINPIQHIGQVNALIPLTYGGEFTVTGGVEKPITPTNIQVKNPSAYGCKKVRPVRIGNELFFVQRSGRKLRAMAYKYEADSYSSPDMSVLSEHATKSGIVDMAYQQEPESILFLVRADGVMATMTVDRDQDVIGWARQITDGAYESVASIPSADGDQMWAVVRRTINGQNVRYLERFVAETRVDCAVIAADAAGAATWTGLDHLEGKTVDIVADGAVMQQQVVSGGAITLPRAAYAVQIGLPFKTMIKTLTPEMQGITGSAQGNSMRIGEISMRFLDTIGGKINGQPIASRNLGTNVLDKAPEPFTGVHRMVDLGWTRGSDTFITIEQDQPLPFHVLAVIKKTTIND